MKILIFLCSAFVFAMAPHVASAHDRELSKPYSACMDKSGGVTMEMIECIGSEVKRQDTRLNKAYKALMAELTPPRKTQLQEAQRAWLKYRDTNCNFYFDPDGGSMARVSANDCMMTSTADRAGELEAFKQ